jgi:hypothetical protein
MQENYYAQNQHHAHSRFAIAKNRGALQTGWIKNFMLLDVMHFLGLGFPNDENRY